MSKTLRESARSTILFIVTLVVLSAFVAIVAPVRADEAELWQNFGEAPFAGSREEAFEKRESAFRSLGLPSPVVELFIIKTEQPGERVLIVNGDRFIGMMSKNDEVMHNVLTAFTTPPVKDGRMEYAAPAEKWEVEWKGQTFTVYLPDVCFNWALQVQIAECAGVDFEVNIGDEVKYALVTSGDRLPASACWELCDGDECAAPPAPCDDCDWIGAMSVLPIGSVPTHTASYTAKNSLQTLRFPREVMDGYFAACITREGRGQSDSWIVQPSAWQEQNGMVTIPYGGQEWPVWGQSDYSKWKN